MNMLTTTAVLIIELSLISLSHLPLNAEQLFENEIRINMHMLKTYDNVYNVVHSAPYYVKVKKYANTVMGNRESREASQRFKNRYSDRCWRRQQILSLRRDEIMHSLFMLAATAESPDLGPTTLFVTAYVKLLALRYSVTFANCAMTAPLYPRIHVSFRSILGVINRNEPLSDVERDCRFVGKYLYWFAYSGLEELMTKFDKQFCGEFTKKMAGRNGTNACKLVVEKFPEVANKIGEYVEGLHFEEFQQYVKMLETTPESALQRDISIITDGFENENQVKFFNHLWGTETNDFGNDLLNILTIFKNIFYGVTKLRSGLADADLQLFKPKKDSETLALWAQASHLAKTILQADVREKKPNFESDQTLQYLMYQSIGANVIREIELERASAWRRAERVAFSDSAKTDLIRGYDGFVLQITVDHASPRTFALRCDLRSYFSLRKFGPLNPPPVIQKENAETNAKRRILSILPD